MRKKIICGFTLRARFVMHVCNYHECDTFAQDSKHVWQDLEGVLPVLAVDVADLFGPQVLNDERCSSATSSGLQQEEQLPRRRAASTSRGKKKFTTKRSPDHSKNPPRRRTCRPVTIANAFLTLIRAYGLKPAKTQKLTIERFWWLINAMQCKSIVLVCTNCMTNLS